VYAAVFSTFSCVWFLTKNNRAGRREGGRKESHVRVEATDVRGNKGGREGGRKGRPKRTCRPPVHVTAQGTGIEGALVSVFVKKAAE